MLGGGRGARGWRSSLAITLDDRRCAWSDASDTRSCRRRRGRATARPLSRPASRDRLPGKGVDVMLLAAESMPKRPGGVHRAARSAGDVDGREHRSAAGRRAPDRGPSAALGQHRRVADWGPRQRRPAATDRGTPARWGDRSGHGDNGRWASSARVSPSRGCAGAGGRAAALLASRPRSADMANATPRRRTSSIWRVSRRCRLQPFWLGVGVTASMTASSSSRPRN